nr:hypothetical protein GCM10017745_32010 [Saccharothrix mutabilis subsp. capreolus]
MFLALTVVSAVLAVSTPVWPAGWWTPSWAAGDVSVVVWLAVAIAGSRSWTPRWGWSSGGQSARIGEGLIYDLRRAVFEHVQACGRVLHPHPDRALVSRSTTT